MSPPAKFEWFTIREKRGPEWARSCALASDGTVYIPAALLGAEAAVLLCAAYDGEPLVSSKGHSYVSTTWAKREYPQHADFLGRLEGKVRAARCAVCGETRDDHQLPFPCDEGGAG